MPMFREDDVRAGRAFTDQTRLRLVITQLQPAANHHGTAVGRKTRDPFRQATSKWPDANSIQLSARQQIRFRQSIIDGLRKAPPGSQFGQQERQWFDINSTWASSNELRPLFVARSVISYFVLEMHYRAFDKRSRFQAIHAARSPCDERVLKQRI